MNDNDLASGIPDIELDNNSPRVTNKWRQVGDKISLCLLEDKELDILIDTHGGKKRLPRSQEMTEEQLLQVDEDEAFQYEAGMEEVVAAGERWAHDLDSRTTLH